MNKIKASAVLVAVVVVLAIFVYFSNTQESTITANVVHHHHDMMITSEEQFVFEMIPHHQEAVDTASLIADQTANEELHELSHEIVEAQTREIAMMESWKAQWYSNSPYVASYMNMMPDLESLSVKEADIAFLQGMIMHHQMAIMMAQQVLLLNPRPEVADFARGVIEVQSREITQMQKILRDY